MMDIVRAGGGHIVETLAERWLAKSCDPLNLYASWRSEIAIESLACDYGRRI